MSVSCAYFLQPATSQKGGRRFMGLGKHGKCRKLALPRMLGKLQIDQAPPGLCKH